MIANISKGHSNINNAIQYHFKDEKISRLIGYDNMGYTNDIVSSFKGSIEDLRNQSKVKNDVFSVSLNLVPGENVSDDTFIDIAKDYMNDLGYGEQPYIVFRHEDRPHEHIHIVSSRIKPDGKKISDSLEKVRSQKIVAKIEKKYNLLEAPKQKNISLDATTIKSCINRSNSFDELKSELNKRSIDFDLSEKINNKGEISKRIFFYSLDKNGKELEGTRKGGSRIHRDLSVKKIEEVFSSREPKMSSFDYMKHTLDNIPSSVIDFESLDEYLLSKDVKTNRFDLTKDDRTFNCINYQLRDDKPIAGGKLEYTCSKLNSIFYKNVDAHLTSDELKGQINRIRYESQSFEDFSNKLSENNLGVELKSFVDKDQKKIEYLAFYEVAEYNKKVNWTTGGKLGIKLSQLEEQFILNEEGVRESAYIQKQLYTALECKDISNKEDLILYLEKHDISMLVEDSTHLFKYENRLFEDGEINSLRDAIRDKKGEEKRDQIDIDKLLERNRLRKHFNSNIYRSLIDVTNLNEFKEELSKSNIELEIKDKEYIYKDIKTKDQISGSDFKKDKNEYNTSIFFRRNEMIRSINEAVDNCIDLNAFVSIIESNYSIKEEIDYIEDKRLFVISDRGEDSDEYAVKFKMTDKEIEERIEKRKSYEITKLLKSEYYSSYQKEGMLYSDFVNSEDLILKFVIENENKAFDIDDVLNVVCRSKDRINKEDEMKQFIDIQFFSDKSKYLKENQDDCFAYLLDKNNYKLEDNKVFREMSEMKTDVSDMNISLTKDFEVTQEQEQLYRNLAYENSYTFLFDSKLCSSYKELMTEKGYAEFEDQMGRKYIEKQLSKLENIENKKEYLASRGIEINKDGIKLMNSDRLYTHIEVDESLINTSEIDILSSLDMDAVAMTTTIDFGNKFDQYNYEKNGTDPSLMKGEKYDRVKTEFDYNQAVYNACSYKEFIDNLKKDHTVKELDDCISIQYGNGDKEHKVDYETVLNKIEENVNKRVEFELRKLSRKDQTVLFSEFLEKEKEKDLVKQIQKDKDLKLSEDEIKRSIQNIKENIASFQKEDEMQQFINIEYFSEKSKYFKSNQDDCFVHMMQNNKYEYKKNQFYKENSKIKTDVSDKKLKLSRKFDIGDVKHVYMNMSYEFSYAFLFDEDIANDYKNLLTKDGFQKFSNTMGKKFIENHLDRIKTMSDKEKLDYLSSRGIVIEKDKIQIKDLCFDIKDIDSSIDLKSLEKMYTDDLKSKAINISDKSLAMTTSIDFGNKYEQFKYERDGIKPSLCNGEKYNKVYNQYNSASNSQSNSNDLKGILNENEFLGGDDNSIRKRRRRKRGI